MKTENYKFIIELPDGSEITSNEYEYEWKDDDENDYENSRYTEMLDKMEQDKIKFVFNTLSIRYEKQNDF